jgi:hypothetical protein
VATDSTYLPETVAVPTAALIEAAAAFLATSDLLAFLHGDDGGFGELNNTQFEAALKLMDAAGLYAPVRREPETDAEFEIEARIEQERERRVIEMLAHIECATTEAAEGARARIRELEEAGAVTA